ncbi:MAG: nucleotidyl transferase AbiEii/AbiGii toxin family protein [Bacteroidales bacterium]|nr:nucleotidyl transferase AbiEii/AbiGii toxin family protein [Bacteroidales bacterium]
MGEIPIITQKQKDILKEVAKDPYLSPRFYLTGGTALSEYYLHHRISVDLDLFSEDKYDENIIADKVRSWSEKYKFRFTSRYVEPANIYMFKFPDGETLKVDFNYYSYRCIEPPMVSSGLKIDSKLDIAINKLLTVTQRVEVKDFVDLYYLLGEYSFWDLRTGVERKFRIDIEPILIASDFLAAEEFEYLPKMLKPLKLETLKKFFRDRARVLGKKSVG